MSSKHDILAQAPSGYALPWVVQPGQPVALHANLPRQTQVDIVQIGCANDERQIDGRPHGPAERITVLPEVPSAIHGPQVQCLVAGAQVQAECEGLPTWSELSLVLAVQRMARGATGHVLSLQSDDGFGISLRLSAPKRQSATLMISVQPEVDALELELPSGDWMLLVLDFKTDGGNVGTWKLRARTALCRATVPNGTAASWTESWLPVSTLPLCAPSRLHLGTQDGKHTSADVRVDLVSVLPRVCIEALAPTDLLACEEVVNSPSLSSWELSALREPGSACLLRARYGKGSSVQDLARCATLVEPQRPYSAVRGVRWDGRFQGPQQSPAHYTALHFNSDTLLDAHWNQTTVWHVPDDLASGAYAFRLLADGQEKPSYVSFFVSGATRPRHPLAVLLPTFTYLAYANAPEGMRGEPVTEVEHLAEMRLDAVHPSHGRSIYERHPDGQGVLWGSSRHPLWSVSPGHRPWGLVADSWLLDWLTAQEQAFDVITDHDLHRLGAAALEPYRMVLTGHHPEYTSTAMWDGLWGYLQNGGRMLYLGGNGFYWRTACDEEADAIEVRRAEDGTRPSIAPPGEYHCAFTGEYGGIWRRLGRPPQQIVGVGMAAQGFERASYYRKCDDAQALEMAFVFEGVDADTFGHSGWWGGGASGWEIDRCDADLGTPVQTWWLARSEGHAESMLRTKEELLSYVLPFKDAKARSDVALAPVGRGDVFSVGSMTWIGSLQSSGTDATDAAKITSNVIRRFLDPTPLPRKSITES
jgi:N,N-dimethylformamidase